MGADDKLLEFGAGPGMLDLIWRAGLSSCWLFLRGLEPASLLDEEALRGLRVGEDSREARGEEATELSAEDCLEGWCSEAAGVGLAASEASDW